MQSEIPNKLYFKIGEVSKIAGVAPHVLRYWESEFSAIRPKRANSRQRLYRRSDVELILKIKTLLHGRGFTISGARRFLVSGEDLPQEQQALQAPAAERLNAFDFLSRIKGELLRLQDMLTDKK
ncbi:MAG: MerR family transcriptional regulator [Desulfocapsaceae bacterium]|nr:MerR family transcriptional regulator [Desulfocapsaceae bacterium]